MKRVTTIVLSAVLLLMYSFSSDETPRVKDYLNIQSIQFDAKKFDLCSSHNPVENHFRQEYLPDSSSLENYREMVVLEAFKTTMTVDDAVKVRVAELSEWKKRDPLINWKISEHNGEKILDFVLSDGESEYEWNLYRYLEQKNKKEKKLVLCTYSYRENIPSDDEMKLFYEHMVSKKDAFVNELQKINLSQIKVE